MVRFGDDKLNKTGFTANVSEGGLFIRTNSVYPPGATIQVEIDFPERTWRLWARVAWAKKVPARLAHVLSCGMGVSFLDPPDAWYDFYTAWRGKSCHF
jgi:Tfp pilus assembly protein PilZ